MRSVVRVAQQEIYFLFKTPAVLLVLLVAPLVYPFMYNYLYVNKYEIKVPLIAVDLDKSTASRTLLADLDATQQVTIAEIVPDIASVQPSIESGKAFGALVIPQGYEQKLKRAQRPVLRAYFNTTRFMVAVDAGKGLTEAIVQISKNNLVKTFMLSGLSNNESNRLAQPLSFRSESLANTVESYGDFIIPALLLLILQQSLLVGAAAATAGIGRKGHRPLPNAKILSALAGRFLPYFVLYSGYAAIFFSLQYALWKIPFSGNAGVLAALTELHLATIIAAGFLIGSFCRSRLTALLIGMFSSYPLFLLSGLAWPLESMPRYLQAIARALPATQYFPTALAIARLNAGWRDIQGPFVNLALIFAGVSLSLLMRMFALGRAQSMRK